MSVPPGAALDRGPEARGERAIDSVDLILAALLAAVASSAIVLALLIGGA